MKDVTLVYGEERGSLVVLPEEVAKSRAADIEAISRLSTYGEARALVTAVVPVPGLDDDEDHSDDEPYNPRDTEEYQNGEWPVRAATVALDHLPDDLDDIGEEFDSLMGLPYLHIDPKDETKVVAAVRERGYRVRRDDALIGPLHPS